MRRAPSKRSDDPSKTPARSAFGSALRRLARRDHSETEIRSALVELGHGDEEIEETVGRLKAARYLDDHRYAERYTLSRLTTAGHGRARIRQSLRQRGVAGELVEQALTKAASEGTEREALEAVARKYWRLHARVEPEIRLKRLWAFLLRRGFPAGLIHDRLRSLWPRQGAILEGLEVVQADE
jgi:regulatory protein